MVDLDPFLLVSLETTVSNLGGGGDLCGVVMH